MHNTQAWAVKLRLKEKKLLKLITRIILKKKRINCLKLAKFKNSKEYLLKCPVGNEQSNESEGQRNYKIYKIVKITNFSGCDF